MLAAVLSCCLNHGSLILGNLDIELFTQVIQ